MSEKTQNTIELVFSSWWKNTKLTQIEDEQPATVEVHGRPMSPPSRPVRHRIDFDIDFHLIDEFSSTLWLESESLHSIPPDLLFQTIDTKPKN